MKSIRISCLLLALLIIFIAWNSYYVNSTSTDLLNMLYALPAEPPNGMEIEYERLKSDINEIIHKWDKNAAHLNMVVRYTDFERINLALHAMKEFFFDGRYTEYAIMRHRAITALEKQKNNELPNIDNIL